VEAIHPPPETAWRFPNLLGEQGTEGTQALETDLEAYLGDGQMVRSKQLLGALDP